ncbi:MAG: alpha/beta fold hydrolase [Actinobacteria bacterium]|nr:alpha/beta fold hydrolase [Actinomycetota bacterium]
MPSPRRVVALVVVLALGLTAVACTDDPLEAKDRKKREREPTSTTKEAKADTTLDWRECEGGECATLTVPLDYDEPDEETIEVALIRIPATDPDEKIGSLLVNPGGPGASGVDFVADNGFFFPDELRERFDIVGFDPRGTGATEPIECVRSLDEVLGFDYSPDSEDERQTLEAGVGEFTQQCETAHGDLLDHISSQDTVRDIDRIREAVGDEKLTYVGFSYGTYLGSVYADFFPDKVRSLALDGAVDPALTSLEVNLEQAAGFERSLTAFLENCAGDRGCAFYNGGDPQGAYDALVAAIDAQPLEADGRRLGPNEFDLGVAQSLYSGEFGWDSLAQALAAAADGDAGELLILADEYTGRRDDGSYDGLLEPFWAIGCTDGEPIGEPGDYPALEEQFRAAAPRFGITFLYSALVCSLWPADPVESPNPLDAPGAPPILVVGTLGDPATPYQWAESLAEVLDSGLLLTAEGEQHTAYLTNQCVTDAVNAYLIELEVPAEGTRCEEGFAF